MTQAEITELFNLPKNTLNDWRRDKKHTKHNLAVFLFSLDYEETKKEVKRLKEETSK